MKKKNGGIVLRLKTIYIIKGNNIFTVSIVSIILEQKINLNLMKKYVKIYNR